MENSKRQDHIEKTPDGYRTASYERTSMKATSSQRRNGEDAFGKFHVTGGPCLVCNKPSLCIHYNELELPEGIEVEATILKDESSYIGITCGDYAKFHRQVAHIQDRMRERK